MTHAVSASPTEQSTSFHDTTELSEFSTVALADGELAFTQAKAITDGSTPPVILTTAVPIPITALGATAAGITFLPATETSLVNGEIVVIGGFRWLVSAAAAGTASLTNIGTGPLPGPTTLVPAGAVVDTPRQYWSLDKTNGSPLGPGVVATREALAATPLGPGRWLLLLL